MADVAIPNYTQLATQTQASNQAALDKQTQANRPNQTNQSGSIQWTQDPTTGQWTQNQTMNNDLTQAAQGQQQTQAGLMQGAAGLTGQAVGNLSQPLDTSGMTGVNAYDPNKYMSNMDAGFGSVQGVTDAMMGRLQPQMDQSRAALVQRLRSQGISQDSGAYQRAMNTQDQSDVDARQRALLAGTSEYNTEFNRNLQQNQQNSGVGMNAFNTSTSDRARQMQEATTARNQPLTDIKGMMGAAGDPALDPFAGFASQGNAGGVDYTGAGKDTYQSMLDAVNAQTAKDYANRQGNINAAGATGNWLNNSGLFSGFKISDLAGLFGG